MTSAAEVVPLGRNRNFRLVWLADTISSLGNGVSQLAYPLLMLAITGSPLAAGVLSVTRALPYVVLGLPAGALVDRWNRRLVMIICDLVRAVNMVTIPVTVIWGALSPAQLYVTSFIGGTAYVFFNAAQGACLPHVVAPEQLTRAVSAQETAESVTGVVAAPIGGALLQLLRGLPFLLDAISFLASAVCFMAVRTDFRSEPDDGAEEEPASHRSWREEVSAGVIWMWRNKTLRMIGITAAGLQLAISGVSLVAIVIARGSGASSGAIGITFSAIGIGGAIGAVIAPKITSKLGTGGTILLVLWVHATAWVFLAFTTHLSAIAAALGLFTLTMPWFGIAAYSYLLKTTPDHLRGRVGTAFNLLLWIATPLSGAIIGYLLDITAPRTVSLLVSAWIVLIATVVTASKPPRGSSAMSDVGGSLGG